MKIISSNVTINVNDLEKSISFYKSLGFELVKQWGEHFAQMKAQDIIIGLHPNSKSTATNSGNVSIGFTVEVFEEAKTLLDKLLVKSTVRIEEGGDFIHFTDPDGTSLYFIKSKGW